MHCFITGTGTDVGKTFVTRLMLRALVAAGHRAVGYKPVACGDRDDAKALLADGFPGPSLDEINPIFLPVAAAPFVATSLGHATVDVGKAIEGFRHLAATYDHVLVEGAGGWEVPLVAGRTVGDLAADLQLPVVVVVDNRLGALNHTILTVNAIRARGLKCAGLILNHLADERDTASITNRAILEEWLQIPVLQDILHQESETDAEWILDLLRTT
ncbi:MAG: dethiobiotin synthase [Verrucomicrobiales bacterium]